MKSASISHAGLVTGKDSKRFVFVLQHRVLQLCEADVTGARDIFGITRTVLQLQRCGHLNCQAKMESCALHLVSHFGCAICILHLARFGWFTMEQIPEMFPPGGPVAI